MKMSTAAECPEEVSSLRSRRSMNYLRPISYLYITVYKQHPPLHGFISCAWATGPGPGGHPEAVRA